MGYLFDSGIFSVEGLSGEVLPGALLYWYEAGTSTPLATYSDPDLTTPNTNPVVAAATGRFGPIYLQNEPYKFILKDALGNTLVTRDDVTNPASSFEADLSGAGGSALVGFLQAGTGAQLRTVQSRLRETVSAKDFGAVGDGVVDDTAALQDAINYCQTLLTTLYLPPGIYKITDTLILDGEPITITGAPSAPNRHGSAVKPATLLQWHGGNDDMFEVSMTFGAMMNFGVENLGSARTFFKASSAQHWLFQRLSFITNIATGINRFSQAVFRSNGNNFGYTLFDNIFCAAAAENFIYYDGQGTGNGVTPIEFRGRCVFESNGDGSMTVFYVKDENFDQITMRNCTFNQQAGQLVIFDNRDTPVSPIAVTQFTFEENEVDIVNPLATDRAFRFTNCANIAFNKNQIQGGGAITALAELVNSSVTTCSDNQAISVAGPLFNADATSQVFPGMNRFDLGTTRGIVNDNAAISGIYPLTFGATVTILGDKVDYAGGTFLINATSNIAFLITYVQPTGSAAAGFLSRGQRIRVMLKNTSGGALGPISLAATIKCAGGAFPLPANGFSRTVEFVWDGTNLVEVNRTNVDVPN